MKFGFTRFTEVMAIIDGGGSVQNNMDWFAIIYITSTSEYKSRYLLY